jgi:ribosomal protein L11 methyltransferase
MGNYLQITFRPIAAEKAELLIAQLHEANFEGFEEEDDTLKAYVREELCDLEELNAISEAHDVAYGMTTIEETNWNAVWESNFDPVIVDDFVAVRAGFHAPISSVEHEIVITPKMSFGTGHHATTFMMMQQMRELDFNGKSVFDFGTGTGVLAILAVKLGAAEVIAVDNDDWSIANAQENLENNDAGITRLLKADSAAGEGSFDIILANINKNVILDNMVDLKAHLKQGGTLLLSGLLVTDEEDIRMACEKYGLIFVSRKERHNWLCIKASY